MQPGDKVLYVPDQVHARQRDRDGAYPWVFGWKTGRKVIDTTGARTDEVVELDAAETSLKIAHIRRQTPARQESESTKLVFIRPNIRWQATVKLVDEEAGTANLDVIDGTTGTTLHYNGVPIDDSGKAPHSCSME